jgi:hypothetical protein
MVAGSGGTAPYVFSLDGGASQASTTFSDLSAGSYTITITDADGCTSSVIATLTASEGAITLALTTTDSECGNDIGTITASAAGGDGDYMFSLDGGTEQASGLFTQVSSGSHTVAVSDGAECTSSNEVLISSGTSWADDIMPIINANCAVSGCHNGDNGSSRNWTVLSNVQNSASNIKTRTGTKTMPPASSGKSLTDAEIELIACWVDDGAQEN